MEEENVQAIAYVGDDMAMQGCGGEDRKSLRRSRRGYHVS